MRYRVKTSEVAVPGVRRAEELTGLSLALFEQNQALAHKVMASFRTRIRGLRLDPDDVRQVALCGLWSAAASFDPSRGLAFSTIAYRTIQLRLLEFINRESKAIEISGYDFSGIPARPDDKVPDEPEWINEVPPKTRAMVRDRIAGLSWAQIAGKHGYADAKSARAIARRYYTQSKRKGKIQ